MRVLSLKVDYFKIYNVILTKYQPYGNTYCQIILLVPIFTTRMASDPKVMGTVESGSSRRFIWHLAKSNQTYGYGDIKCQENSAGAAAAAGVH